MERLEDIIEREGFGDVLEDVLSNQEWTSEDVLLMRKVADWYQGENSTSLDNILAFYERAITLTERIQKENQEENEITKDVLGLFLERGVKRAIQLYKKTQSVNYLMAALALQEKSSEQAETGEEKAERLKTLAYIEGTLAQIRRSKEFSQRAYNSYTAAGTLFRDTDPVEAAECYKGAACNARDLSFETGDLHWVKMGIKSMEKALAFQDILPEEEIAFMYFSIGKSYAFMYRKSAKKTDGRKARSALEKAKVYYSHRDTPQARRQLDIIETTIAGIEPKKHKERRSYAKYWRNRR